jgi:hypothetical protein
LTEGNITDKKQHFSKKCVDVAKNLPGILAFD